ncbi:MAG: hypothetical protein HJJLKODD_02941 [Phycisphaerae bacterium]|nr:hypothetical protein [Phycisphaerae bacterium]
MRNWRYSWTLLISLVICGCSGGGGGGNGGSNDNNDNTSPGGSARITGRLTVLPEVTRTEVLEEEPNDTPDAQATPISVTDGSRYELFGNVLADNDAADSFTFVSDQPLEVTIILNFDFDLNNNLAFAITDFQESNCTLGGVSDQYSECFDNDEKTEKNPESGQTTVRDTFAVTVVALANGGDYVMGLEFSAAGTGARVKHQTAPIAAPAIADYRPAEMVVKFDQQFSAEQRQQLLTEMGWTLVTESPAGHLLLAQATARQARSEIARKVDTQRALRQFRQRREVRWAEPNYMYHIAAVPDDEFYGLQWHYDLINLPDAWDLTTGSEDVVVGVVDTGIIAEHPEITDRLDPGFDFISDPNISRDGGGIDDDPHDDGDLSGGPGQSSFHGTHVSGTIGAVTNNGSGVAGVTWNCRILPARALGVGGGTSFDIGEAIRFAAGLANVSGQLPDDVADVINLSIAGPAGGTPSTIMQEAIAEAVAAGVVVVAAAGNEASGQPSYPGAFPESISISACDPQFNLAPYSNFGATINISAPGGNLSQDVTGDGVADGVLSLGVAETANGLEPTLSLQHGTSMATPHVSGTVALMKSINPNLTVDQIREVLSATAFDAGDAGRDDQFGDGVINAALAVREAALLADVQVLDTPRLSLSSQTLDFSNNLDTLTVQVINTGAGVLDISDVVTDESIGSGWLTATSQGSSGSSTISAITVQIDREGLEDGVYVGTVRVLAVDQPTATISVNMRVGEANAVGDTIFVVAIDSESRISIAQDETSSLENFTYSIQNLPAGVYRIYAGTDRDLDDLICDLGELCGGHPSTIEALPVTITEGQVLSDIDFPVGTLVFLPQARQHTIGPIQKLASP